MDLSYLPFLAAILVVIVTITANAAFLIRQETAEKIAFLKAIKNDLIRIRRILCDDTDITALPYLYPELGVYRTRNADVLSIEIDKDTNIIDIYDKIIYYDTRYKNEKSTITKAAIKVEFREKLSNGAILSIINSIGARIKKEKFIMLVVFICLAISIVALLVLTKYVMDVSLNSNSLLGNQSISDRCNNLTNLNISIDGQMKTL